LQQWSGGENRASKFGADMVERQLYGSTNKLKIARSAALWLARFQRTASFSAIVSIRCIAATVTVDKGLPDGAVVCCFSPRKV